MADDTYEVFALRYGSNPGRKRSDAFLLDPRPDAPQGIDYFFWIARNSARTVLIDTGFDAEAAARLNRPPLGDPAGLIRDFGIDPLRIETLVLTHLHFDHAGALAAFPAAHIHLQQADIDFATGPLMNYAYLRYPYERGQVAQMLGLIEAGRVTLRDGDAEIAPGLSVHRVDGHAIGLQVVRIATRRGPVVLASDAAAYAEHFLDYRISPILVDAAALCRGYDRLRALAASEDRIIPGHDPLISALYPRATPDLPVFALHEPPSRPIRAALAQAAR